MKGGCVPLSVCLHITETILQMSMNLMFDICIKGYIF
jgi:hypothetical protein